MQRWPLFFILLVFAPQLHSQDTDSIAYTESRAALISQGHADTNALIRAADELAVEGLFRDALSLLQELPERPLSAPAQQPERPAAATQVRDEPRRPWSWKISAAADYTHLEDVTVILTPEAKDSLDRLKEEPFTVSTKAVLMLKPSRSLVRSADPSFSVSNRKAVFDCPVRMDLGSIGEFEAAIKAEKRLTAAGSTIIGGDSETEFLAGRKDSLDMAGGRITLTPGTNDDRENVAWKMPMTAETARYRHGRGGYYSFNHYRAAPELSWTSGDMRKNAGIRFLGEYKDYFSEAAGTVTRADSFDIRRFGPEVTGDIWRQRFSASASAGYLYEQYLNRGIPFEMRTINAETQLRTKPFDRLEALVRARFERRNERDKGIFAYNKDSAITFMGIRKDTVLIRSAPASFSLSGCEAEIAPALRWSISPVTLEARCPMTFRSFSVADSLEEYRLVVPLFIIESRNAFEPELGIDYSGSFANVRASGAYTTEKIPARDYYTQLSNRGWKTRIDCTGSISRTIFVYAQAEHQYRLYAPCDRNSRTSKNTTAACGFSVRF